jgi:hypothetical protein
VNLATPESPIGVRTVTSTTPSVFCGDVHTISVPSGLTETYDDFFAPKTTCVVFRKPEPVIVTKVVSRTVTDVGFNTLMAGCGELL